MARAQIQLDPYNPTKIELDDNPTEVLIRPNYLVPSEDYNAQIKRMIDEWERLQGKGIGRAHV